MFVDKAIVLVATARIIITAATILSRVVDML
jgi:hypothetical protein